MSNSCRLTAAARVLAAVFVAFCAVFLTDTAASAQVLSVVPVNVFMMPGQRTTTLSVTNPTNKETAVQIRTYAWSQAGNDDRLAATNMMMVSPPMATIAPGATQVVRLVLRQSPPYREATYRILIDQIPPPAEPGVVHMVLRLSIPIFVQPEKPRAFADVQFQVESKAGQVFLVGSNRGLLHESVHDIVLTTSDGHKLKPTSGGAPYILEGSTRRWQIDMQGYVPRPDEALQLTAKMIAGAIEQQVRVVATP